MLNITAIISRGPIGLGHDHPAEFVNGLTEFCGGFVAFAFSKWAEEAANPV
jgi:hypothetical protein